MAGKQTPRRHIATQRLSLRSRNIDEVALYFKELQNFSTVQDALSPSLLVKALPQDSAAKGRTPETNQRTNGQNIDNEDELSQLKLNFDPSAKRKPGQVLKLHATKNELMSKKGASFGWVDPPRRLTPEELRQVEEDARNSIANRVPLFLRRYERNRDGSLSDRVVEQIRLKALGPKIGQTVGRISTGAFRAAGGWIDDQGKLRCPPGSPNANQFTDVDMSNCFAVGPAAARRGFARIRAAFDRIAEEGAQINKYGRRLTPQELEDQKTFEKSRSALTTAERVREVAKAHVDTLKRLTEEAGIEFDDSVEGGNFDLIMSMRAAFPEGEVGDSQFFEFLFGTTEADIGEGAGREISGGILGDVLNSSTNPDGFIWEGDRSPESIRQNLQRYDQLMREQIQSLLPPEVQQALTDPDADPAVALAARELLDTLRKRHHLAQREAIGTTLVFKEKYPEAFKRIGRLRAMTFEDVNLKAGETWDTVEGSTRPEFDTEGNLKATVSISALNFALTTPLGNLQNALDTNDTAAWHLDIGDTASEAERNRIIAERIGEITDAIQYFTAVAQGDDGYYANQGSMARLAGATGDDAVVGRARHVVFHELGHVVQYQAYQEKVIDYFKNNGSFPMVDQKTGSVIELTDPPSTWTNNMWMSALLTVTQFDRVVGLDFPPDGTVRFEKDLVHMFAGKRYLQEVEGARQTRSLADLAVALNEGMTELWALREMGMVEGPLVDEPLDWMDASKLKNTLVSDIPYGSPPARTTTDIVIPSEPDIPVAPTNPRDGAGATVIYNGPVYNGPVNITIVNGSGTASEMDTLIGTADKPIIDGAGVAQPKNIRWQDIEGHIYMDDDTQWSPASAHNIEIEQNPEELRRFVDAAFGLGPDEGGPDPTDELGSLRQKKDAYWKMGAEQLDARFEKLRSEFVRLRDKSMTEPLSQDEQARMWLAIKGMRQILDVNTRRSKMSDAELGKYEAKGFNPQPGKYMRKVESIDKPQQNRWRTYAIERRKSRGFDDIEEIDDDELTHWSREIGDHVGDVAGGKDGFDGSARQYDPSSIRTKQGLSAREKRRRSPEYEPTPDEISSATLANSPELVGRRKIDEVAARATPQQKQVLENSDSIDSDPVWGGIASHSARSSSTTMESLISTSARARQRQAQLPRDINLTGADGEQFVDNVILNKTLPLMDLLDSSIVDEDISIIAALDVSDDLKLGHVIDHGAPLRGLLVPHDASESFNFASPDTRQRAIITIPKGARALHSKNAHNGETDGVLMPPGSLEVVSVDPDGRIILMPSRQKTSHDFIDDAINAIDSVKAERGTPVFAEKRYLRRLLIDERKKRPVPSRSTRGKSGDAAVGAKADIRSGSVNSGFNKTGSDFFGTTNPTDLVLSTAANRSAKAKRASRHLESSQLVNESISNIKSLINDPSFIAKYGQWISPDLTDNIRESSVEELVESFTNAIFRFHEGFDDRPRIAIDSAQYTELLNTGRLSNAIEKRPNSPFSMLQRSFETDNGLSDAVPNSSRSHFGFLTHAINEKEVQDFLDELPTDGLIRESRFFSSAPGINQSGDLRSGGKTIELVLNPEVSKRTAYSKGDPMDDSIIPSPVLSQDKNEVVSAIINNLSQAKSEDDFNQEVIQVLDMAFTGNMSGFGSGIDRSSRSTSARSQAPTYGAVIGGGINITDIENPRIDISQLELAPLDPNEFGGRAQLLSDLRDAGIRSNVDDILDILLNGDLSTLPEEAEFLRLPFARLRSHKSAVAYTAKFKEQFGDSRKLTITNPEGVDLTSIDALTNLPFIDADADDATRLSERLRYDIYGARLRTLEYGTLARDIYRDHGKLPVSRPHVLADDTKPAVPGAPVSIAGPVGTRPIAAGKIDAFLGKPDSSGRHKVFQPGDPGWESSRYAIIDYDAEKNELRLVDKDGVIETISDVDAIEAIQLNQQLDDDGGFDTIDRGVSRLTNRTANRRIVIQARGTEGETPSAVAPTDPAIGSAERLLARGEAGTISSRSLRRRSRRPGQQPKRTETQATRDKRVQTLFEEAVNLGNPSDSSSGLHRLSDTELADRFSASRTGRESLIDGTEIYEVNDVESAAALIAAGYHIQLGEDAKPEQLVGASAQLQKDIDSIIPELRASLKRDDPSFGTIDTCRLYVGGTNVFCEGGLGTARSDMPQLSGRAKGDDAKVVGAMKGGLVKTDWKSGRRSADGTLTRLSPEEQARFDELKKRHVAPGKEGTLTPEELNEFYSLVDWNDTEADLTPQFKEYVARVTGREDVIVRTEGILPSSLAASQGQIQMGKTGGMVISMRNHDYSFQRFMAENYPGIQYGSDEYYDYRDSWLYKGVLPDGSPISFQMFNTDGEPIDKDGNIIPEGQPPFFASGKPWYTNGSIISTKDGFVVDGHHRWASFMAFNEGKPEREQLRITSDVMDMPIDDALSVGKVMQDHWGIKPAVLGAETYFVGDGRASTAIDKGQFTKEMADLETDLGAKLNKARDLYFKRDGFGGTVEKRTVPTTGGGVRVRSGQRAPAERINSVLTSSRSSSSATPAAKQFKDLTDLGPDGLHGMSESEIAQKFGLVRTGDISLADGKPIYRVDDVDTAAALLAAGYNVDLGDKARAKKVQRANKKLQKQINQYLEQRKDLSAAQRAAFTIDACRMFVSGTNIFCGRNIGTKRMDMPQLSGRAKGDDSVAMRAGKAGLVKVDWKPGVRNPDGSKTDLTPEQMSIFEELKARHASPKGPGSLTDEEKAQFYSLVDWNDTEIDMVPEFLDHLRRIKGDNAVSELNDVSPDDYSASQGQIQAEKVTGMLEGIEESYNAFVAWTQSQGIKRGSTEFHELRKQFLSGKLDNQIPILDADGKQKLKDGKPQFANPWWNKGSIITSKDGYVVDGHHRWAAVLAMNLDLPEDEQLTLNTKEINSSIFESLSLGKAFQDSIGIKEAKLGEEDLFVPNANAARIDSDGLATHISEHEADLPAKLRDIAERGTYMPRGAVEAKNPEAFAEGMAFIEQNITPRQSVGPRVRDGQRIRRNATAATQPTSSRSSALDKITASFNKDYPMMSSLGIDPRPSSDDEDASYKRAEAERLLNGANASELRRMESIAKEANDEIAANRESTIAQISEMLGSRQAYDDLSDFEKPVPREWTELSDGQRQEISDLLDAANKFESDRQERAKNDIFALRENSRRKRANALLEARRVASRMKQSRSSRSVTATRGEAVRRAVPVEKVADGLADAFLARGTAGVMSKLRSMLKNDSSDWAIDYAKERGFISESQAKILKKLADGVVKRFINPSLAKRNQNKRRTKGGGSIKSRSARSISAPRRSMRSITSVAQAKSEINTISEALPSSSSNKLKTLMGKVDGLKDPNVYLPTARAIVSVYALSNLPGSPVANTLWASELLDRPDDLLSSIEAVFLSSDIFQRKPSALSSSGTRERLRFGRDNARAGMMLFSESTQLKIKRIVDEIRDRLNSRAKTAEGHNVPDDKTKELFTKLFNAIINGFNDSPPRGSGVATVGQKAQV